MNVETREAGVSNLTVPGAMAFLACLFVTTVLSAADAGNRLAYLDDPVNPYYVNLDMPKLVTPQWVGEDGVQAVIVLAVDDMSEVKRYEEFLRPILNRLKAIDGRAPVSIMTKNVDPLSPQLAPWLKEGVSIETHTADHPCPLLQGGKLESAKATYDRCVDLLFTIPDTRPVAFRMPCCDSMNSVSPRFFAEIFNKATANGRFLTIDTSVFQVFTADDPALSRDLVVDEDGREKFRKYIPTDKMMVNLVEDYPYPYVIGHLCWEFPCLMPSDWDAQYLNGKCSPTTVRDLKAAVDATVIKQGVFSLCFHPHGWITNEQVVELIDYAHATHGGKVKFLNFREVEERLTANLLSQHPLRGAKGGDNGVRVLDVNNDGYMDVLIGRAEPGQEQRSSLTRIWRPSEKTWDAAAAPFSLLDRQADGTVTESHVSFGILQENGYATAIQLSNSGEAVSRWDFDGHRWIRAGDANAFKSSLAEWHGRVADVGIRLRDLDADGKSELVIGNPECRKVYRLVANRWELLPWSLPERVTVVDAYGGDTGLRFVDLFADGSLDLVFSNAQRCAAWEFVSIEHGWSRQVFDGPRTDESPLPMLVRADGSNNGAWFSGRHVWVQNEDTGGKLPHHVEHRQFPSSDDQAR